MMLRSEYDRLWIISMCDRIQLTARHMSFLTTMIYYTNRYRALTCIFLTLSSAELLNNRFDIIAPSFTNTEENSCGSMQSPCSAAAAYKMTTACLSQITSQNRVANGITAAVTIEWIFILMEICCIWMSVSRTFVLTGLLWGHWVINGSQQTTKDRYADSCVKLHLNKNERHFLIF